MSDFVWHPAPAKVNLFLHVLGRRADGYHRLQTVFRLIDRADRVGIALRADGEIVRRDPLPGVPSESDLVVRAARALKAAGGTSLGAEITVDKVLPTGGGLGGGSSDAATTLLVLNRLWHTRLDRAALMQLGLALGADVPVFLFGQSAIGEGVGEQLRALDLPPAWVLVLVPQVSVSTKEIFSHPALTRDTPPLTIPPFFPGQGRNDLEPVVRRLYAQVGEHLDRLREVAPQARMSGSGACVFAEFESEQAALQAGSRLPAGMNRFVARGLDRHPLRDWAS